MGKQIQRGAKHLISAPKKILKEALRITARVTREAFSTLYRVTGIKAFDRIGDGAYLLAQAIKQGDWKAMGAVVSLALGIAGAFFAFPMLSSSVGLAYSLCAINISVTALDFAISLHTAGAMYQQMLGMQALKEEWNQTGIETIAQKDKWLAGGYFRNACFAGGDLFVSAMLNPNAQVFRFAQNDLSMDIARIRMPYEDKAGGEIYNSTWAGSEDWNVRALTKRYYQQQDVVEKIYEKLGMG